MNFFDKDRAAFDDFDNATITITREGVSAKGARGEPLPGVPIVVLEAQGCQVWDLSESDKAGLSGEEIRLMRKVRLHDYHEELTEKMLATLDGKPHNILLCGDDGTRSFSILTVRLIKS